MGLIVCDIRNAEPMVQPGGGCRENTSTLSVAKLQSLHSLPLSVGSGLWGRRLYMASLSGEKWETGDWRR